MTKNKKKSVVNNNQMMAAMAIGAALAASGGKKKKSKPKKKAQVVGSGAYAYGRGKYSLGRSLGGALGGALGASLGVPGLGTMAGRSLGGLAQRKISGRGAYVTNDLVNGMAPTGGIPVFGVPDENGTIRIRHKEYIGDIFSPATPASFTLQTYSLNPALGGVFPWLAQTASNYDEYEFAGLIFTYNPVVSDSSNSGAMGTIILGTVYNAGATPFINKQQMLEYSGAVSARICDTIVHGVECDPTKHGGSAVEYTRAGAVPTGQDIKTYDLGIFSIATSGVSAASFPSGTQLGELWVSYDVILRKPKFWDALGYSILRDSFYGVTGVATTLPLGTAPMKSGLNSIGGTLTKSGSTVYTFPDNFSGYVLVQLVATAATSVAFVAADCVGSGNVIYQDFYSISGATNTSQILSSGGANTPGVSLKWFRVSQATASSGNFITFTINAIVGTVKFVQLDITEVNPLNGSPLTAGSVVSNYVAV